MTRHLFTVRRMRRLIVLPLACALVSSVVAAVGPAALLAEASGTTWTADTTARSEADVRAAWEKFKPSYSGSAYTLTPSTVHPYAAGDLAVGFRTDGLGIINFARYLVGLPSDVTLKPEWDADGQHGAVLLKAIQFSHYPTPKPADMDQIFYDRGYRATSRGNIGSGYTDSESFQKACLDDSDSRNITSVGHRRWLLNPRMLYTGIGFVENRHTTYAIDHSRPATAVDYSYIAWPSAGLFPVEFCGNRTPWSITLNPARYDWDATGHTVILRRVSDGRTWMLDASDTNKSGEYFGVDFGGYGVANAFIFRPDPATVSYSPGDRYDVTLSGGIYAKGTRTPVTVAFRTTFMSLAGTAGPSPSPDPAPTPTSSTTPVYRFYNKANGSHFYTASTAERDTVKVKYSATYQYEGPAYSLNPSNSANSEPLYRFYNKVNGSHFYTASVTERDAVIAKWPATYAYEGSAYKVSLTPVGTPMYRFYNKANGSHFYTASAAERDTVKATLGHVFRYEGSAFYLAQ